MDEMKDRQNETEKDVDDELKRQIGRKIQQEIKKETKTSKADKKRFDEGLRGEPIRQVKVVKVQEEHLTLTEWLLLIFLGGVPVLGWIMLVRGMMSQDEPKERPVFCKAYLIYQVVLTLIVLCFVIKKLGGIAAIAG